MRRNFAVVPVLAFAVMTAPCARVDGAAAAATPDFIRADGRHLVHADGARFDVKGINLGNWLVPEGYMFKFKRARSPSEIADVVAALIGPADAARFWTRFRDLYVAQDDIRFIAAAGFNTVRVPLNWRLFMAADANGDAPFDGPGWRLIDRLIGWCRDAGLRVILDLHAAPGGQTGVNHDDGPGFPLTFYVPRYRDLTISLWREIARRYAEEPTVLGYDLLNEPISPYSDEAYLNPRLEELYRDIVAGIRSVDKHHVVLLAGGQWSTHLTMFGAPFDDNVAYTYHKFWAKPTRDAVQEYVDFSERWRVPVLVGETGEYNDDWNTRFRKLNEAFDVGWCFWPYKSLDSHTAAVSIAEPTGWDKIAAVGSVDADARAAMTLPPRAEALSILNAYLDAAKFSNVRVNAGYIESLGLTVP